MIIFIFLFDFPHFNNHLNSSKWLHNQLKQVAKYYVFSLEDHCLIILLLKINEFILYYKHTGLINIKSMIHYIVLLLLIVNLIQYLKPISIKVAIRETDCALYYLFFLILSFMVFHKPKLYVIVVNHLLLNLINHFASILQLLFYLVFQ